MQNKEPRDYARLHMKWYEDEVLEACADQLPACLTLWPVLIAMAKDSMHHVDNPTGLIRTTAKRLASIMRADDVQVVNQALELFVEGEFISIEYGRFNTLHITLSKLAQWQVAQGSSAERQQRFRDRASREKQVYRNGRVTERNVCVTQTETETETETKRFKPSSSETLSRTPRRIRRPSSKQVAEQITAAKEKLGANATLVDQLVAILAESNKTGTVAESRALRELWGPLAAAELSIGQMAYGLHAAIKAEAPNANYVKRAAESYQASTPRDALKQPRLSNTTDDELDAYFSANTITAGEEQ